MEGFTPHFGASLFAAAAAFVRVSPWESLASRRPIQFTYRLVLQEDVKMKLTAFGSVVGDTLSGSFGLSVHKTLGEAVAAFKLEHGGGGAGAGEGEGEGGEEEQAAAPDGQSCMFGSVYEVPFEDVDAAETHGWELAPDQEEGGHYWPLFCKIELEKGEDGDEAGFVVFVLLGSWIITLAPALVCVCVSIRRPSVLDSDQMFHRKSVSLLSQNINILHRCCWIPIAL